VAGPELDVAGFDGWLLEHDRVPFAKNKHTGETPLHVAMLAAVPPGVVRALLAANSVRI
jgi:ankyrin repeat protein